MKIVKKGNVEKTILDESLVADYISAGWKVVSKKEVKKETPKQVEKDVDIFE